MKKTRAQKSFATVPLIAEQGIATLIVVQHYSESAAMDVSATFESNSAFRHPKLLAGCTNKSKNTRAFI
jgi:hypothetical protein